MRTIQLTGIEPLHRLWHSCATEWALGRLPAVLSGLVHRSVEFDGGWEKVRERVGRRVVERAISALDRQIKSCDKPNDLSLIHPEQKREP